MTTQAQVAASVVALLKPLVANRAYRLVFPQSPTVPVWPAIRYTFIDATNPSADITGEGDEETADYRLQIDVVDLESKGPTSFATLCAAVKAAMKTLAPTFEWDSQAEEFDAETKTTRLRIDYMIYLSTPA